MSNYGKHLWIDHQDGRNSHYAHLDRIDVSVGQVVTAGQQLGLAGSTGNSSGPHLHFDLTWPGKTYTDASGQVWPWHRFNPWWELDHLYKPGGRTILEGWVYDPYLTKGSDGQAVNYSTNLSLRSGPGSNHPKIGTVPYGTIHEMLGDVQNSYRPVLTWAVAENPPANKIDLLPYLRGDGRQYTVKHAGGQQENFQCQSSGNLFWLVKNSQYEAFMFDDDFIYRGIDTSPGPAPPYAERPGELRYYWQHEQGQQWAKWCPRHMAIGETWVGPGHVVEYFYKDNCQPSAANSGNATNTVTLKARYTNKVWNGVTIADSVELWTGTTSEGMFFGYNWSLVSWGNQDGGASAVKELLPSGTPDLERETGCFSS